MLVKGAKRKDFRIISECVIFQKKKSTPIVKVQLTERTGRLQIQLETCRVQDTEETDAAKGSKKEEAWFRDGQMNDRYIMSR